MRHHRRHRRLQPEQLESRRLFAVLIVGDIPTIEINEGSQAQLSSIEFIDSDFGNNYSASVRWSPDDVTTNATVSSPSGTAGPLSVRFDYRFDTRGFFGAQQRAILDVAAEIVTSRLNDSLAAITSSGINQFSAHTTNPETGQDVTISNFSVAANEFVVFVGARNLPSGNLGLGGPGGGSAREPFFTESISRGQIGVPATDFAPWGGGISFDQSASWYFGTSQQDLGRSQNDFLSVAVHELMHVLGFSPGVDSFVRYQQNGRFTGPAATNAYDGNGSPPIDDSHFPEGLTDDGREVAMDPTLQTGQRKLPTQLDFAVLDDLGWQLRSQRSGLVSASRTYLDNGSYESALTVRSGGQSDTRTFLVTVNNVAPELDEFADMVVVAGQPLSLNIGFDDPGVTDTHDGTVAWGDGTVDVPMIDNRNDAIVAQHAYAQPGIYSLTVGIRDDDNGQDQRSVTVTVVEPPRGDWQNTSNPLDVNEDTVVSPIDALLVINELNFREVSDETTGILPNAPAIVPAFFDVTGDDIVSPTDALAIINALNSPTAARTVRATTTSPIAADSGYGGINKSSIIAPLIADALFSNDRDDDDDESIDHQLDHPWWNPNVEDMQVADVRS